MKELMDMLKMASRARMKKTVMGNVDPVLLKKFTEMEVRKEKVEHELQSKIREAQQELHVMVKEKLDPILLVKDELWNEVYETLGIDPEESYDIDLVTGDVIRYTDEDDCKECGDCECSEELLN